MTAQLVETIKSTIQPNDHPYMKGAWRPTFNEWNAIFANGDAVVQLVAHAPPEDRGMVPEPRDDRGPFGLVAVSYNNLTLPTIRSV